MVRVLFDLFPMPNPNSSTVPGMAGRFLAFSFTFLLLFGVTFAFLALVDATPEGAVADTIPPEVVDTPVVVAEVPSALPVRVVAKAVGLDATVVNPTDTDIAVLDKALLKGAVRYPTSAQLGVDGTVLLFGHSSYLPIVRNQAYKTFNEIQKLKEGDVISVYSDALEYRYRVTVLESANAMADTVALPQDGKYLKLITCNTFGKKEDRFIVTALFEGAYSTTRSPLF